MGIAYYVQIIVVFIVLMSLMYGMLYIMKLMQTKKFDNKRMKVIEYLPLESQVGIYIIKVDNKEIVLGVGGKKVDYIEMKTLSDFDGLLGTEQSKYKKNDSSSTDKS